MRNSLLSVLFLAGIIFMFLSACSKKEEDPPAPDPTIPVLTTDAVKAITQTTAICGGSVTSDGGASVTGRGICWNMTTTPEITDPHTSDGSGVGTFTSQMTGLTPNTLYYIRAYATNSKGTAYGITKSFRTLPPDPVFTSPVVTTEIISAISQTAATCGGTVTDDGGSPVILRGICWSMSAVPQVTDNHTSDGAGTGAFTSLMTELTPDTLYFVRAYAANKYDTGYGDVKSFRTLKVVVDTVTDTDGNVYHIISVGRQKWLRENLHVTHYRNGDAVPKVTLDTQWKILTTGAYCSYDNLASNSSTYGNLYNWHALSDPRGICPSGWHVPSDTEWAELGDSLGGSNVAGGKLKSTGTIESGTGLWYAPNTDATNSSGFTGLPGGYRINYGNYYSMGNVGCFWSSTETNSLNAWKYVLDANNGKLNWNFDFKTNGFSVRCCKD